MGEFLNLEHLSNINLKIFSNLDEKIGLSYWLVDAPVFPEVAIPDVRMSVGAEYYKKGETNIANIDLGGSVLEGQPLYTFEFILDDDLVVLKQIHEYIKSNHEFNFIVLINNKKRWKFETCKFKSVNKVNKKDIHGKLISFLPVEITIANFKILE